ncbi:group II intron reverse transcriptase/maturase [Gammaproteobacteria bacterium AB-CW1]|uniref:Group II intron reverse transcriptase/maturase n=1 Tax=Natronospira elongata TaxID=3110268 RepID=A0AAP6JI70_9GAMM|nr:group II intron reverse transcriptase/maturase [Gammaproteobacteria bacterium AB-CW1]
MHRNPTGVYTRQQRIACNARSHPERAFTSLAHHLDLDWLLEAYRRIRKDGAVGVDGQTAAEFEADLYGNLERLREAALSGRYRAPPARRVYIPKGDGTKRPLGIPTLSDKILQRAVAMLLEPIFEQDFLACSFGFRPGRSAHQALDYLWRNAMRQGGGWVFDVDIQRFFETLDHDRLREVIARRVSDGVIRRLIGKWLNAGVMEGAQWYRTRQGTPQGGVISPLLANAYLHAVVDEWFDREVQPRLKGRAFLVRYADDLVIGFTNEVDARRVAAVMAKRLDRYNLRLHPEKSRLVPFRAARRRAGPRPGSFDFLGFTHYWGRSRAGRPVILRKTAKTRVRRVLGLVNQWCRRHRHWPVAEQCDRLSRLLRGHYAYYGVIGNSRSLRQVLHAVKRLWIKWLGRRSQRRMNWETAQRLLQRYPLPPARLSRYASVAG